MVATACGDRSGNTDRAPPPSPPSPPALAAQDARSPFTYEPRGCAYAVTLPDARGFTDATLDDPTESVADAKSGASPLRVRLGLGGGTALGAPGYADPSTSAVFTWETADIGVTAAKVRIGTDPSALVDTHGGYSWTIPSPTAPAFGSSEPPSRMHEVHVCGLSPGKTYYYAVGGGAPGREAWSATQSFTTPPARGSITIGISGDARDSADVLQLVQLRMRDAAVSLQLFSGDFVLFGTEESLFSKWLDKMWKDPADPARFLTLGEQMIVAVPGNHENDSSQFFGNFALPGDETYASFNLGAAHFVMLDDEPIAVATESPQVTAQLAWLKSDLATADHDRAAHPFIVAVHHRGEASTARHASDADVARVRSALMPLWDAYHVDLVINGHDHNYERSKPISLPAGSNSPLFALFALFAPFAPVVQTDPHAGTTYVVCAGAGASASPPGSGNAPYRAFNAAFGPETPYVGVYALLTIDPAALTLNAYGLKSGGGGVTGDDLLDTYRKDR